MQKEPQTLPFEFDMNGFSFKDYFNGEETLLNPQLKKAGFKIIKHWFTSDGDSCGPLVRSVYVEKDGKQFHISYG